MHDVSVHHVVPLHLALAVLDGAGGGDLAAVDEVAHLVEGATELGPAGLLHELGHFIGFVSYQMETVVWYALLP